MEVFFVYLVIFHFEGTLGVMGMVINYSLTLPLQRHDDGEAPRFPLFLAMREEKIGIAACTNIHYFNMFGLYPGHQQLILIRGLQVDAQARFP